MSLRVKELAFELGKSPFYVYQMRHCGFPMTGITGRNQTATVTEALAWIKKTGFRIVNGKGGCKKVQTTQFASRRKPRAKSST